MTTRLTAADLVAATTIDIVEWQLGDVGATDRRCFRIKNLLAPEIEAFVSAWQERQSDAVFAGVKLVVSAEDEVGVPAAFRAEHGRSITYYRNNNEGGLVYIQGRRESDEQGLKNIFTLRDNNFLDGSFDTDHASVPDRIFALAWKLESGGQVVSAYLGKATVGVLHHLHPDPAPISIRKFAAFVLGVVSDRLDKLGAMESADQDALIGRQLTHLGLFPDPDWTKSTSTTVQGRRLGDNALRAELAKSAGTDLDQRQLAERCERVRFLSSDGEELPEDEQRSWRRLCAAYCESPKEETRVQIPYSIFEQLFKKDVKGLPLGERVRNAVLNGHEARLPEFDGLDVKTGLDTQHQGDAQKFLDAEPADAEDTPLADLVGKSTRKMVERLAFPTPSRFENPLIALVEAIQTLRPQEEGRGGEDSAAALWIRRGRAAHASEATEGLFAFLYGPTLLDLVESSHLEGLRLKVDEQLTAVVRPPEVIVVSDDEGEQDEHISWAPLPIEFALLDEADQELCTESGEWLPDGHERLALLWLSLAAADAPPPASVLVLPDDHSVQSWTSHVVERSTPFHSAMTDSLSESDAVFGTVAAALELREKLGKEVAATGIRADRLNTYFDSWAQLLHETRTTVVPDGSSDSRIRAFIGLDCMEIASGDGVFMLPGHPFKMRWLAKYLARSEKLARDMLTGTLALNRANERMYLEWIGGLSPEQQPAVLCTRKGELAMSTGEFGLGEEYLPLAPQLTAIRQETLGPSLVDELAKTVSDYLQAHPYKADGLRMLVVHPQSPSLPVELIKRIRRRDWRQATLDVHVLATDDMVESLTAAVDHEPDLDGGTEDVRRGTLPRVQVSIHIAAGHVSEQFADGEFDIAVVPRLLGDQIAFQENTEPELSGSGSFDPLIDRATHIYGGDDGGAISVSMRPRLPDQALNDWSTLSVRNFRTRPIAPLAPENTDLVELRVNFEQASKTFVELHELAHWVITLERHITRAQIESLESRPDVLVVREGVGATGTLTLIVSSNSGREFIYQRIERKLENLVGMHDEATPAPSDIRALAERIYQESRDVAPGLILRAMGISRATEEILGLAIARRVTNEIVPAIPHDGVVAWVSLDEHTDWFGGGGSVRADLCRFTFERVDDTIFLDVLVLEGKLRRLYDAHGVEQVRETMSLIAQALPRDDAPEPQDASVWRARFLAAIEASSFDARSAFGKAAEELREGRDCLPDGWRERFRDGNFVVRTLSGLFSICLYDHHGALRRESDVDSNIEIVRSTADDLTPLISGTPLRRDSALTISSPPGSRASTSAQEAAAVPKSGAEETPELVSGKDFEARSVRSPSSSMNADELERTYQDILDTFAEFNVSVLAASDDLSRCVEGPASILFSVRPGAGVDPKRLQERDAALRLKLGLSEDQQLRWTIGGGHVRIDVPKRPKQRYFVVAEDMWAHWRREPGELTVPLGEDQRGQLVFLNFSSSKTPHLLIGGTTGAGKSEALRTILYGLIRHFSQSELKLVLVDPKGTELQEFQDVPHLEGAIGWDHEDALAVLNGAVEEMQARYRLMKEKRQRSLADYNASVPDDKRLPWKVIVLDEYGEITAEREAKKELEDQLKRLAQKARACGIHLIIATQNPSADVISTNVRSNLPAQLALRVRSGTESRIIMDEIGAEALNGSGDAFLKSGAGVIRVQCARVDSKTPLVSN